MKPKKTFLRLTHEETCELVTKAQAGDKAARAKLIDANIGLVWTLAMKQCGNDRQKAQEILACGIAGNDFESEECTSGLVRAIQLFDVTRGQKFSTYARHWIAVALRDATIEDTASRNSHELHWQIRKASAKLIHILKRDPTSSEVAEHLNRHWASEGMSKRISAKKVESLISLGTCISTDPHELEQLESRHSSALSETLDLEMIDQVRSCLDLVTTQQRECINLAFGFNNLEPLDYVAIGKKLGVNRHEVSRRIRDGLKTIKDNLKVG